MDKEKKEAGSRQSLLESHSSGSAQFRGLHHQQK